MWLTAASVMCRTQRWLPASLAGARARGEPAAFDQGLAEGQTWTIDNAVAAGAADAAGADA